MACDRCLGSPDGCRHCGTKPLRFCPDCEDGCVYYKGDVAEGILSPCTKEVYDTLPEESRYCEECPTCKGEGWL